MGDKITDKKNMEYHSGESTTSFRHLYTVYSFLDLFLQVTNVSELSTLLSEISVLLNYIYGQRGRR